MLASHLAGHFTLVEKDGHTLGLGMLRFLEDLVDEEPGVGIFLELEGEEVVLVENSQLERVDLGWARHLPG